MKQSAILITTLLLPLAFSAASRAQQTVPTCDDLVWSAQLLATNPDIRRSCQGIYIRGDELFAKVRIQLTRVRANRITFRPRRADGSLGNPRSMTVDPGFRARIDGRQYRLSELATGQELDVYIPEDRFALAVDDGVFDEDDALIPLDDGEPVNMSDTAGRR